ncbi:PepSY domain-containing protein [Pseudogracilibacillus sp. SE30717A]|uniref:PepSY domain-containing protein n=1 Tax=Pseudogracilibacillus sp. SE30717A TaxID=3098293 RepID=UPI00300DC591
MNNHFYPSYHDHSNWQQNNGQITIEEAMRIALERVPGQVVKVELEQRRGAWVYEVEILTPQGVKYEVKVDINTGAIVKVEID